METKFASKIGEMMAFCLLAMELHDDIGESISKSVGEKETNFFIERNENIFASLEKMMEDNNTSEIAEEKAIRTARKLKEMRKIYLKDIS